MELADRIERRLKLQDLRILMTVVQAGSMGKAAKQLGTAQPAISRAIANLEHMLGVPLLDRSTHGVEATAFGHMVINRGTTVFDELRQAVSDIEFLADPTAGEVRIATSIAAAVSFVSAVIDRLSRQYARLSFDVLSTDNVTARKALAERRVDLTIGHLIERVPDSMSTEILLHEPHVVVMGSKSALVRRRNLRLKDLVHERWMLPPPGSPFGSVVHEAFRSEGLDLPRAVITSLLPLRSSLLPTGRFLMMVPQMVSDIGADKRVVKRLPLLLPSTVRPFGIITVKNRSLSPPAELFIEHARKLAATVVR
ncbi:LysR family transcriptional regulator [Bradyrhizobium sp. AUGA SZCCT0283]|uniref:LysR family transcriptional regulator n=1 Tax=Bradyrhizobium sp. AUGA SZCCT0283 TaxID=2807671 RepID=UPI001BAC3C85|nr:LysR family transcriptional regulator [Bradyrhizobium sp. AUGA SZCCT0283]MBR1280212.1 LysR family transcriptional regulator [Bradyrhizobium sp. AUGA SZCCT0283]